MKELNLSFTIVSIVLDSTIDMLTYINVTKLTGHTK